MTQGQPDVAAAQCRASAQRGRASAQRGRASAQRGRASAQRRARLALAALLLVLIAAGIRAADPVIAARGPLHADGKLVAAGLELVLIALLTVASRRRRQLGERPDRLPAAFSSILVPVLQAGAILLPVAVLFSLIHPLHLPVHKPNPGQKIRLPKLRPPRPSSLHQATVITEWVLLALLALAVVACVLLIWRWRRPPRLRYQAVPDEDFSTRLRHAVQAGRLALAAVDDARAAIIACYVAMEQSLARAGAVRAVAETPDELLARAVSAGLVSGGAAGRLTALFYQARFSARPLPPGSLAAARQALTELGPA